MGSDSSDFYYNIESIVSSINSTEQTKENQSFDEQTYQNNGNFLLFRNGFTSTPNNKSLLYYGQDTGKESGEFKKNYETTNGYWGNKDAVKASFGKNAFSLGINDKNRFIPKKTIQTYNLNNNNIQNFTLPNGQNLLSFLKENKVQTGDNVEIRITKNNVQLKKKK